MIMQDKKTAAITLTALLTAMTFIATTFFKIPVGLGYIHLGDVFVILAALMLPRRYACFAGAAGAALADIMGGFAVWAPWTVLVKVVVVLIVAQAHAMATGKESDSGRSSIIPVYAAGYVIAAIWTAFGYYVAEGMIYGNWVVPFAGVPFNLLQFAVGAVLAHLLFHVYARIRM